MDTQPQRISFRHVVLAAVLGSALSVVAFFSTELHERDETAQEFRSAAEQRASIFAWSLGQKLGGLHALASFFDASQMVEPQEFHEFVEHAYRARGDIEVFQWIPRVREQRDRVGTAGEEKEAARSGAAKHRKNVFQVLYSEPRSSPLSALGSNPGASHATRRLLRTARASGTLAIGRAADAASPGDGDIHTVMMAVYDHGASLRSLRERRRSLRGFVALTFRLQPVLETTLEHLPRSGLDSYIFDVSDAEPRLLYFHRARTHKEPFEAQTDYRQLVQEKWRHATSVPIANREWVVVCAPAPEFFETRGESWQWSVLVLGFTLTALVVRQLFENQRRTNSALAANERLERAQTDLSQREAELREIVDLVPHMIFATDDAGRLVLANAALAKMYDTTVERLVGGLLADLHPSADEVCAMLAADRKVLQSGEAVRANDEPFTDARGRTHTLEITKIPYGAADRARRAVLAVCVDVTERNAAEQQRGRLEQELRQSQKMESLGNLAGGIAHEFNNLLGAIIGYSELAMGKLDGNDRVAGYLRQVLSAGDDAAKLVKQILAFSRTESGTLSPVAVAPVIDQALSLLKASIPAMIEIRSAIDKDAGTVIADETQVHQIVMNLCTNAYQAIGDRTGTLDVSLERIDVDAGLAGSVAGLRVGPYVRLRVADSGCGMDADTTQRIFEPFFTTKPVGVGTGMGLPVVHGIVANHGGAISVASTRGSGTTFDVYLPRAEDVRAPAPGTQTARAAAAGEHVLLVDDEPALANLARQMLEELGYRVTALQSSLDALAAFRSNPSDFSAVITDQAMPGMSGSDLAKELLRLRPGVPIILATGYSREVTAGQVREMGLRGYVRKPYRAADLDAALQAVLRDTGGLEA